MPLLVAIVALGIALSVASVHFTGGSRTATLDGAVAVLTREYQNNPTRHEVGAAEPDITLADHRFWKVEPGDRVAMLLGNGIPFPVVLFATLRLGAIAVPLSTREQSGGLAYMLAHAGAKLAQESPMTNSCAAAAGFARRCATTTFPRRTT